MAECDGRERAAFPASYGIARGVAADRSPIGARRAGA